MQYEIHFIARYAETDQMGIIHHSNYPIWFEAGRTDFLKKAGLPNSNIEALGVLLPLSYMECSFKKPARYEDEIIVRTKIKMMTCSKIKFEYVIENSNNGTIIALGSTIHAWTDKSFNPLNIEKALPELFIMLKKTLEL